MQNTYRVPAAGLSQQALTAQLAAAGPESVAKRKKKAVGQEGRIALASLSRRLSAAYARCGARERGAVGAQAAFPLLERTLKELLEEQELFEGLPVMAGGEYDGRPRVVRLAEEIVQLCAGKLTEELIVRAVEAYQTDNALTISELWGLLAAFRLALVRLGTAQACEEARRQASRERAARIFGRAGALEEGEAERFFAKQELQDPFFAEKLCSLADQTVCMPPLRAALEKAGLFPAELASRAHRAQVRSSAVFESLSASLKLLEELDWESVFCAVSKTDRILAKDGVYGWMDPPSRRYYLSCVQRMAKKQGVHESHVARCALALAQKEGREGRKAHVGWYLAGDGAEELKRFLTKTGRYAHAQSPGAEGLLRRAAKHSEDPFPPESTSDEVLEATFSAKKKLSPNARKMIALLAAIWALSQGLLLLCGWINGTAWALLLGVPASVASWTVAQEAVQRLLAARLPVRFVPRLALKDGVPDSAKTLVVLPALVDSAKRARELMRQLEVHYYACERERNLYYALLADLPEAGAESAPEDDDILEALREEAGRLNQKHGAGPVFFALCRKRQKTPEGKFMGRERKRGALEELNALLLGGGSASLRFATGLPQGIRFVLTLDSDTKLPYGAARSLIGALLHPLNAPQIDENGKVQGHAVIAPRMECTASGAQRSGFARLFSGRAGLDSYATSVSETYQDLFGQGNYGGKGIYDVRAFSQALSGKVRENTVLSHDLLEGSYAGAAFASDIALYDDWPARYLAHARRTERWIRGDWQLVWYLLFGKGLTPVARYKLTDNLRRSLVAPAALAVCLAAPFVPNSWPFVLLSILSLTCGALVDFVKDLVRTRDAAVRARDAWDGLWAALYRAGFTLAVLPYEAWTALGAIVKALWRTFVTHRNMLEWVTAADAQKGAAQTVAGHFRAMLAAPVFGTALFVSALFTGRLAYLLLVALWWCAPLLAALLSRSAERPSLSREARGLFEELAKGAWRFFEANCLEKNGCLPPDNVQTAPKKPPAERTSPTNIAMALLAPYSACALGEIGEEERDRWANTLLQRIDSLPKWKGHLYNWIDVRTGKTLAPAFVSSVDSGNLAAALFSVRELAAGTDRAELAGKLLKEMDFSALYDWEKELFYIGYDAAARQFTPAHYDLLASEARLLSLTAIAKGDVPAAHWFRLGRPITAIRGRRMLVSWSGTMFEYLMPVLFTGEVKETLLGESVQSAVEAQKSRGFMGVWGVSESGYYAFDPALNYQYRAFGIPGAGISAAPNEAVVAPYASALAALCSPESAAENLFKLKELGACGEFGSYEAVDFTPRRAAPEAYRIVKSFMAHHVGMSLAAYADLLAGGLFQKAFLGAPEVRAAGLLLEERPPERTAVLREYFRSAPRAQREEAGETPAKLVRRGGAPEACLLCGKASVWVCSNGFVEAEAALEGGEGRQKTLFYRPSDGALDGAPGCALYVKDPQTKESCLLVGDAKLEPWQAAWKGKFQGITWKQEVFLPPQAAEEVRLVTLTAEQDCEVLLYAYAEPALCTRREYAAHRAFQKLFVTAEERENGLAFERRGRAVRLETALLGCELTGCATDRMAALGRRREGAAPRFLEQGGAAFKRVPVDPCALLCGRLKLFAGKSAQAAFVLRLTSGAEDESGKTESLQEAKSAQLLARQFALDRLRYLNISAKEYEKMRAWLTRLLRAEPENRRLAALKQNRLSREGLYRFSISGDEPIAVLLLDSPRGLALAAEFSRFLRFLDLSEFVLDAVVLLSCRAAADDALLRRFEEAFGGIRRVKLLKEQETNRVERDLLLAAAQLILQEGGEGAQ